MTPGLAAALFALTATASVRTTSVEVGEPVAVTVAVHARPGAIVTLRLPDPNLPALSVDDRGARMAQAGDDGEARFSFEVVPWVDREVTIPPATVEVGGIGSVRTNAVTLRPFNPAGTNAASAPVHDIRDIRPFPVRPSFLPWIVGGALLGLAWILLRPKRAPAPVAGLPQPEPVVADPGVPLAAWVERVRRIADDPPREPGPLREAHFVIAEAVRRFVEERWEIPATRQTTEEFLRDVAEKTAWGSRGLSAPRGIAMLPAVLEACDSVKWGSARVDASDAVTLARRALELFAASRNALSPPADGVPPGGAAPAPGPPAGGAT